MAIVHAPAQAPDTVAATFANSPSRVPFLHEFVYTSEAPAPLVDLFGELVEGPGTQGTQADVSAQMVGHPGHPRPSVINTNY